MGTRPGGCRACSPCLLCQPTDHTETNPLSPTARVPRTAMRLIFMGTPAFAVLTLEALLAAGHEIALVLSQPDKPAGRGRQLVPPPVAALAREQGLPLLQPRG